MAALTTRLGWTRGRKGAELIEFAVVLPLLLLVIAGIIDFGFLFQSYEVVTNAAREGARVGVLPGYSAADIQARVTSYVTVGGLPNPNTATAALTMPLPVISLGPGGTGPTVTEIRVTVTYPHTLLVLGPIGALFGGSFGTINLIAVSSMRAEAGAGS